MPRYELAPLTIAKMENSNTCGSWYSLPSARRGSRILARSESKGSNDFKATSVIRSPRIDSDFFNLRNPLSLVAPQFAETCCIRDSVQSVEQPYAVYTPAKNARGSELRGETRPRRPIPRRVA